MKQHTVKACVRKLRVIKLVKVLYSPSDKHLHQVGVYIRHDLFAEQEADSDKVAIEMVHSGDIGLDIFYYASKQGKLRHSCALPR